MDRDDERYTRYGDYIGYGGMYGRPFGGPHGGPGRRPMGPYGMPMYGMPGMYSRWVFGPERRFKDIDFGNLYLGEPHVGFFDTRKIIRESLRNKYPKMSDLKLDLLSFGQAIVKHPFRKSVANVAYNPSIVERASKTFKKNY